MKRGIRLKRLLAYTALASGVSLVPAQAQDLLTPAFPSGYKAAYAMGVSADGSTVVGTIDPTSILSAKGFVWTQSGGLRPFGDANSAVYTGVGVSNDGAAIAGTANDKAFGAGDVGFWTRAFRWTEAGGFHDLGSLVSTIPFSEAKAISGDGKVVIGTSYIHDPNDSQTYLTHGFVWSEAAGMRDIGEVAIGPAMAASYDGSVVVGTVRPPAGVYTFGNGFVWTEATGMTLLQPLNGGNQSNANDISDDGRIIAGFAHDGATNLMQAVRWVDGVAADLTTPGGSGLGDIYSRALGISGNGMVIVGEAQRGDAPVQRGFRWTEEGGMQTVEDWLRDSGVTIATEISYTARATNCNGSVVVGETALPTRENAIYIARGAGTGSSTCNGAGDGDTGSVDSGDGDTGSVDPGDGDTGSGDPGDGDTGSVDPGDGDTGSVDPGDGDTGSGDPGDGDTGSGDPGSGLITLNDLNESLAAAGAAQSALLGDVGTLLNGAGSRPLDRRAAAGKAIIWAGGDIGRARFGYDDGELALGELGIGYNFGRVQLNGTLGFTKFDHGSAFGGRSEMSATYVKGEALAHLYPTTQGGLWAVVTGTALWGDADIKRNYLANGGVIDSSTATTDASAYGLRGRLQWENALPFVSPYADIAYSRGCLDSYVETGGAFPAAFNKSCSTSTEMRYGFDATVPVTDRFRVTGTFEGVHLFSGNGASVSGSVVGLGNFNLGGAKMESDWVRAGLGFEADIASTTLSLMGNVTSQSRGTNAWIAANWRAKF